MKKIAAEHRMGNNDKDTAEKRTVLIVEDNKINQEMLKVILTNEYEVLLADNGYAGLCILKERYRQISIVLLDIQMPVMDGFDFLEEVGKDEILCQMPVIVTTGNYQNGEEQKCLSLGAVDFIEKPYKPELTRTRIRNIIRLRESAAVLSAVETDELTGVYIKSAFIHHAERLLKADPQKEYSLLGIDIENFKLTNSQYGEQKCDEFLRYLGENIRDILGGELAGRFGGDQFIVLVSGKIKEEKVQTQLFQLLLEAPIAHQVIKVGIYGPMDGSYPVITCCDRAFWAIKKIKGIYKKNIAYYTDEMRAQLLEEQKILDYMEESLEKGEFCVYYQPKHECTGGRIAGAEALVRWNHPKSGFMSPVGIFLKKTALTVRFLISGKLE